MRPLFSLRGQIILVVVLFAASLVVLLSNMLAAIHLPAREQELRLQLIEASRRMAEEAAPLLEELPRPPREPPLHWRHQLTEVAHRALEELGGVEGGFYLAGDWDKFIGHAYPTNPDRPPEPPHKGKKKKHPPPPPPLSDDPPPKEKPPIHDQCVNSLNLEESAAPRVQVSEIGPSRVMIVTEPVGRQRPAHMATWIMTRLTSPEHTAAELVRFQVATGLSLAGILAALVLTANLGRNLRRERRQREQLGEELRRAEHFAALGKLLAGVAHEVRNPLAAIRSTVQLYQRLPETRRDPSTLDAVLHGVGRLNDLVGRLLYFVRSGHEERRPIDVNAIVQETMTLLRAQADSQRVVLRTELADDLPPLLGSAQSLHQVVFNLMTNGLQAMPNGGTLLCRTRRVEAPPRLELEIADTGPGIAAEELPHLFEPFYTTRPEGTGLGLALCREIVQQHGGRIELDRQKEWGAVFRATLPLETVET
ncbi:MAG TPA: ATP-binding protein [Gemmataceae bacterium]|nr:ATP-binding protein [Gemmataceae bacterium]